MQICWVGTYTLQMELAECVTVHGVHTVIISAYLLRI